MKRLLIGLIAGCTVLTVVGCGEKATVTAYSQGEYQGKPDMQPWDNAGFKGDRSAWERNIRKRAEGQNEYARLTPSAD